MPRARRPSVGSVRYLFASNAFRRRSRRPATPASAIGRIEVFENRTLLSATPTVSELAASGTYDGTPHVATATATGTDGSTVSGSFSFAYYVGTTASGPGSSAAPVNAGTYTAVGSFTSADPNYTDALSDPQTFTIDAALPNLVLSDDGGSFNGLAFPESVTVSGINNTPIRNPIGLNYATFLGGNGLDRIVDVTTDSAQNTFVTGSTTSTDFPTTEGAYQSSLAPDGAWSAIVAKYDPKGSLIWATEIRGAQGFAIAVDRFDNVFVAGQADSRSPASR